MAITTVTYQNSKPYSGVALQPFADIVLIGPLRSWPISAVLVDSGADYIQVPEVAANNAGLLVAPTWISVRTVGGWLNMKKQANVDVEVEGVLISVDLLCHPSPTSRPLLGRNAL